MAECDSEVEGCLYVQILKLPYVDLKSCLTFSSATWTHAAAETNHRPAQILRQYLVFGDTKETASAGLHIDLYPLKLIHLSTDLNNMAKCISMELSTTVYILTDLY
jgi:hypothetical protein